MTPPEANVLISFANPVPDNPILRPKVYYRTLPERYTHLHTSPWVGRGYFEIHEDNTCIPKSVGSTTPQGLQLNTCFQKMWGVDVQCDYVLV